MDEDVRDDGGQTDETGLAVYSGTDDNEDEDDGWHDVRASVPSMVLYAVVCSSAMVLAYYASLSSETIVNPLTGEMPDASAAEFIMMCVFVGVGMVSVATRPLVRSLVRPEFLGNVLLAAAAAGTATAAVELPSVLIVTGVPLGVVVIAIALVAAVTWTGEDPRDLLVPWTPRLACAFIIAVSLVGNLVMCSSLVLDEVGASVVGDETAVTASSYGEEVALAHSPASWRKMPIGGKANLLKDVAVRAALELGVTPPEVRIVTAGSPYRGGVSVGGDDIVLDLSQVQDGGVAIQETYRQLALVFEKKLLTVGGAPEKTSWPSPLAASDVSDLGESGDDGFWLDYRVAGVASRWAERKEEEASEKSREWVSARSTE